MTQRIDLRTLPLIPQHHSLQFSSVTGRDATDYLWICPECDDGESHAPMTWSGGSGYVHLAEAAGEYTDAVMHKLVAVDVLSLVADLQQVIEFQKERYLREVSR